MSTCCSVRHRFSTKAVAIAEICAPQAQVRLFIMIGCLGLSLTVGTLLIAVTMSMPSTTLPNTGCCEGVDLSNQSRKLLCATLMKNWLPPVFGWPVFAMLSVPGSFESLLRQLVRNVTSLAGDLRAGGEVLVLRARRGAARA